MTSRKFGLTNNQLKIIAMVAMALDHIGRVLLPQHRFLIIIGRLAFPIFAYMIAEGCAYTRHRGRYLAMVFGMGLACQCVFFVATGSMYQNILMTFTLSIAGISSVDFFLRRKNLFSALAMTLTLAVIVYLSVVLPERTEGYFLIDYGFFGVLLPVGIYFMPKKWAKLLAAAILLAAVAWRLGGTQWYGLLALPLLALYNGQRGKWKLKYLFYIFYPAHLALIYLLSMLLVK